MKLFTFFACLVFILACKEKKAVDGPASPLAHDSVPPSTDSGKLVYIERKNIDLKDYTISIRTKFLLPDTLSEDSSAYVQGNYLFVFDKNRHRADTMLLLASDVWPSDLEIEDASDSLHSGTLVLNISWRGDSDMRTSELVEYSHDACTALFSVDDLESLQRKDAWNFGGFVSRRDELVDATENDYPFTVSLKDHEVHISKPPKQYIGYPSRALSAIKGYRVSAQNDTIAYTIKKGTPLTVDTLYRAQGCARLVVADSIIVRAATGDLAGKLQHNSAG